MGFHALPPKPLVLRLYIYIHEEGNIIVVEYAAGSLKLVIRYSSSLMKADITSYLLLAVLYL
jgi:hypothetical protein